MKTRRKAIFSIALLVVACAGVGGIHITPDVELGFENLSVSPSYNYWYLNQENSPYAVMGLDRDWQFEDIMWHAVNPGTVTFIKVVGLVEDFPVPGGRTFGAALVDHEGHQIGIWYSSLIPGVSLDPENKTVKISTATPGKQGSD